MRTHYRVFSVKKVIFVQKYKKARHTPSTVMEGLDQERFDGTNVNDFKVEVINNKGSNLVRLTELIECMRL